MKQILVIILILISTSAFALTNLPVCTTGNRLSDVVHNRHDLYTVQSGSSYITMGETVFSEAVKSDGFVYGVAVALTYYNQKDDETCDYPFTLLISNADAYAAFGRDSRMLPYRPASASSAFLFQTVSDPLSFTMGWKSVLGTDIKNTSINFIDNLFNGSSSLYGESVSPYSALLTLNPYTSSVFSNNSGSTYKSVLTASETGGFVTNTATAVYQEIYDKLSSVFPFNYLTTLIEWVDLFTQTPTAPVFDLTIGGYTVISDCNLSQFDTLATFIRWLLSCYIFFLIIHSTRQRLFGIER